MAYKKTAKNSAHTPYIHESFGVVVGGRLHVVKDLLDYGGATHACYRAGTIWYLKIIAPLGRDEVFAALEFTLAHDPITSFICEI